MDLPQLKPATYADLFDLPENVIGEIVNGRLITQPRPAPKHARAYSSLGIELGGPFDFGRNGPGGWSPPICALWKFLKTRTANGSCSLCWKTTPPSPNRRLMRSVLIWGRCGRIDPPGLNQKKLILIA